jgi:hypothetical protein
VEALKVRPVSGEGAAGSGDGTPTGVLAEQGDIMAAVAAVVTSGAGDLNNAESGLSWKIKVFLVFFFSPAAGWDCMPTYGRFFFISFFLPKKVTSLKLTKKRGFTSLTEKVFPST